jgi:hypothetical protein
MGKVRSCFFLITTIDSVGLCRIFNTIDSIGIINRAWHRSLENQLAFHRCPIPREGIWSVIERITRFYVTYWSHRCSLKCFSSNGTCNSVNLLFFSNSWLKSTFSTRRATESIMKTLVTTRTSWTRCHLIRKSSTEKTRDSKEEKESFSHK